MSDQEPMPDEDAEELDFKIRGAGCLTVLIGFFPLIAMLGRPVGFKTFSLTIFFFMYGLGLMLSPSPVMVGWRKESRQGDWLSRVPPFWRIWLPLCFAAIIVVMRFFR